MAIEARNRPLPDWFTRIRTGQTVLPRFQRFEAWDRGRVTQLFNTILQDLPVGAVLILEVGAVEPFISRPLKGAPAGCERVSEHLLDGQQRLTALWRGLNNNYDDCTYFLVLKPSGDTGLPYYVHPEGRWQRAGDKLRRPIWANEPKDQWARRMIPLELCSPELGSQQAFREWSRLAVPAEERDELADEVTAIRQRFASFNLPFLSLPVTTDKEVALDVFMKMNTTAAPLTMFDIIVAQIESSEGQSLHDLVADLRSKHPEMEQYYGLESLVLYASALLQGRPPTNASYMMKDFGPRLLSSWPTLLTGVKRTLAFLAEERVFDAQRLPTDVVIPVLTALWGLAPQGLDAEGRARTLMRKYLWRAFFTTRYESSTNSRATSDFDDLKSAMLLSGNPAIFDDAQYPLPQPQELALAGWPKKRDRLARAVLAVALKHGGCDLADGSAVSRQNLTHREYHHLFPTAHLKRQNYRDDQIFLSVNCAVVTWNTNRNISDKEPERYLSERREGTSLGEGEVRTRLGTHLIPYEEMTSGDYDAFIARRSEMIHAAMLKLCSP